MKKLNLIKRLWTDSHEKQSPQRFTRYTAILIMLLTLGVGQMWALDLYLDISAANWPADGATIKVWPGTGSDVTGTSVATNLYKFTVASATGTMYFKRMSGSSTWNQASVSYNSSYNLYKLTGWDAAACSNANVSIATKTHYIYFDNSTTNWSNSYKYFVIGHDYPSAYSKIYGMTAISNTKLWYIAQSYDSWVDATYYAICSPTSSWSGTSWGSSNIKNANKYAAPYKGKYDMNNGSSYLFTPANSSNNCTLTIDYKNDYSALNYSQTVKKYTSTNGGSTYSEASINSGTVTITPYKLTGNGTVSNSSNTGTLDEASETSVSKDAVYTGEVTVTASANSGYTFVGWFTAASGGSAVSTDASYTYNAPKSTNTIYARFKNETTYTITIANSVNASTSTVSVGATPVQITAPDIAGYTFTTWSAMPSGVTKTSGELTDESIYISATKAATVTANYVEDLSSPYIVTGGNKIVTSGTTWRTTADEDNSMVKKTGYSTSSDAYFTVNVTAVNQGSANSNYQFKLYNTSTSTHYGLSGSGQYYLNRAESGTAKTTSSPGINVELRADALGEYELKVNYSSTPTLTVTYPTAHTVTFGKGTGGNTVTAKYSSVSFNSGTKVQSGKTVTFTQTASTGYQFKEWNTNSSGTGTRLSTSATYDYTVGATNNVYAIFSPKQYTITLNGQDATTAVSPSTVNATYKSLTLSSAITNPLKTGYTFGGWYSAVGGGGYLIINTSGALQASKSGYTDATGWTKTSAAELYAKWTQVLTLDKNGGTTDGSLTVIYKKTATSSHTAATRTGYTLKGYYDATSGGNKIINADGSLVSYSGAVSAYISSSGAWIYNGMPTLYAQWTANSYDVTLKPNGATTGSDQVVRATFDAAMPTTTKTSAALAAPTKTGYTLQGFYQNNDGTGTKYYNANMTSANNWNQASTANIWAKWSPKTTTITLDQTGAASSGSVTTRTGTYNADMPAITGSGSLPTAPQGYAFMGYYDALEPLGTKYYNADGTSAHTWDKEDASFTLHAYFKQAEITGITFSPGTVVENNSTVNVTAVISPEPTGTTTVCWRILYDNGSALDPQPAFTPASRQGSTVSFKAPNASGMYKAEAVLHLGSGCGGSDISMYEADFQVAGSHNVTVAYKQGSTTIKASTIITGRPLDWSDPITAPDIFGYTFDHWTAGDGITLSADGSTPVGSDESSANPIYITAIYNGTLTANYTQKNIVYFKDNLEWTDPNDADAHIYVNLLTEDYWNASNGSGNKGKSNCNLAMDRVPGTADIFYYDYGSKPTSHFISFTKESMNNYESFYQGSAAHVVFPSRALDALSTDNANGLGFYAATPMFVPLATQTPVDMNSGHAKYYNDGYWTKFTPGTGYTLEIYNYSTGAFIKSEEFTSADDLMPMKATVDLEGGQSYKFQLKRDGDVFYGNSGTMTYTDHGQNTAWDFYNNSPFKMCTIVTNAAGEYTFNLSYSPNKGGNSNRLRIAVDYPVASGDYRLVYTDNTRSGRIKPSAIVAKENDGTATVSFFVRKDQSPVLRIQQATVALDGTITWKEYPTDGTPTNQITGSIASAITATGVWNFNLEMNGSGAMSVASAEAYKGNYYIRTDAANSKWDNYRTDPDHLMTYSDYLKSDVGYTHYYTHWVDKNTEGRKNVKFVIANDYSPCISDTLIRETASGTWANIASFITTGGDLNRSANVRFMWDEKTNNIARAYIDGAQGTGSDIFLRMLSNDGKIKQGETVKTSVAFQDNGNWIYEANVLARPEAQIKLKSTWGSGTTIEQYFKGSASETESLVGGSGEDWYPIRVLYDFKTNRLVAAYLPTTGTISSDIAINADVMFIREHQGDVAQLTFTGSGAISKIQTAYGVLRLNKWTINNKDKSTHSPLSPELSRFERDLFYISFPFRVNLEEVFGFGTYGTHWIIEEYDGAGRAQNGFWKDSPSYWKFITNRKGKFLEPNTGYIVALDLDELGESSSVWANTDQVELYFPSYGNLSTITSSSVTYEIPAHTCTINRPTPQGDRRIKDSHWNVISVPTYINTSNVTFANTDWTTTGDGKLGPNFLYTWNMNDNSLTATSGRGYTYKAMHAYIVQYYGYITWTTSVTPQLAPRRNQEAPKDVEFRIELQQNESLIDQTFVRLSNEEKVSNEFAFGEDMSKEYHKNKANIYTLIGAEQVAGNCLPMTDQTTIVPMGIITTKAGEYTISIPSGTNGVGVTLVDNETGIRSNLALEDYTIALDAATYENRFYLEISPIKHVATGIEEITGDGSQVTGARKVMVDGILYIIKDGKVFSTQGARVK